MRLDVKRTMCMSVVASVLLVSQQVSAAQTSYQRLADSEQLSEKTLGHVIPLASMLLAGYGSWRATGSRVGDYGSYANVGVLGARIAATCGVTWAVTKAAYAVTNHHVWPIEAVRTLREQVDDYAVLCSLRKELASCDFVNVDHKERIDNILALYRELLQVEIDRVQEFSGRLCDDQTNDMIDALEYDFHAITKGAVLGRTDVLAITHGGATSFSRDILHGPVTVALLGDYDSLVSPVAELYLLLDDTKDLHEQLTCLCDSFETTYLVKQAQFDNAVTYCMRIARVHHVFDYMDALYRYIKMSC